jgi:hypothetical protein
MQTKSLLEKGFAVGIIVLFVGISFSSMAGGMVITKKSTVQPVCSDAKITRSPDVGVWKIIQPAGPYAPWSPGTYPIKALLVNNDYDNGANFNVNAKIWEISEGGNASLYYEDNKIVNMTPYNWTTVVFNDVEFNEPGPPFSGRENNVSYRLEVTTELADDENPANNQKILNFTICYLETDFVDFKLYGTYEENGWYGPGAWLVIFYNSSIISALYFGIDNSGPILYTGPPYYIDEDGTHVLYIIVNNETLGPYSFKTDGTPPTIDLTVTALNCCHTKWLLNATVADATSGVAKVEFYVDDVLVGNATASPYTYTYKGKGKVAQAIVYDFAGNYAMNPMVTMPLISQQSQSQNSPSVQQKTMLFYDLIYTLLLHHQKKG